MNLLAKLLVPKEDKFLFIKSSIGPDAQDISVDLPTATLPSDSVNAIRQSLALVLNQEKAVFEIRERLFWWQYRAQEGGYHFGPHNMEIWVYEGELLLKDINQLSIKKDSEYVWLSLLEAEDLGFDINLSGLISHSIEA
jgi:hypothetical protein